MRSGRWVLRGAVAAGCLVVLGQTANTTESRLSQLEALVSSLKTQLDTEKKHSDEAINSGNTGFMVICTALVLFMNIPGLALFYGGMAGAKHVLSVVMQTFSITCLISVLWFIMGYSLAFGRGSPFIGGSERFWLYGNSQHIPQLTENYMSELSEPTRIPESVFMMYQCTFAIITSSLMCGSFAERMRFLPTMVFVFFWHFIVYCPVAHWSWAADGFLLTAGVMDFAGGSVVHISSGMSGLVAAIVVGKRQAFKDHQPSPPHNILLTLVGGSMLWVGWFGFNAGSALAASGRTGLALMVSNISAGTGGLVWMALESWERNKPPSVLGAVSGAIAGLVCITPASGYVDHTGAFFIALIGVPVCFLGVKLKHRLGYDDALDAFGVHGVGGITGGVLTGFFANDAVSGVPTMKGAFYGRGLQVGLQIYGIVVVTAWAVTMSYIILKIIDAAMGLRVTAAEEEEGLDITQHGETIILTTVIPAAGGGGKSPIPLRPGSAASGVVGAAGGGVGGEDDDDAKSARNTAFNAVCLDGSGGGGGGGGKGRKASRVAPGPGPAPAVLETITDDVEYFDPTASGGAGDSVDVKK